VVGFGTLNAGPPDSDTIVREGRG